MARLRLHLGAVICALAILALTATSPTASAAAAGGAFHACRSADLRYPFMPGGPNDFGVFRLRIAHGTCRTAHRVAKTWMTRFERNIRRAGKLRLPQSVFGFEFTTLPARAAQTFRERGIRRSTVMRFNYRVPNG